ncbi:MAG: hypothetical protein A2600_05165 [Candidatus Lambdaproteobacteria bacterium RIFOXYD1_FULL_56_27]|uniref:Selenoprotein B glycine/betaine/sarcosine/D-proline reductase n=1 Tax=Candidatus Lambdaproteobacteria bacterium RIFOXYD2_FULL_56_26 TaxID=1817773 RepID=A0A1F6GRM5_9PROT|nr:MAG: hypothetical protein A2426_08020 [Candidatus Lambdaproteobacteria bacterium RIFOXYC1_FULL_56_13]OGH00792.1 MAG: hypothetical protein A2557_03720 [Candidatus Lambdaproteobacteria bacterium RIFOXYD2_FULL_56_26]OGH09943.1 MAG: hypothetical protein A2600_05165 [Candidatus Lambdaproteobacteria bacterium RIFOXYD1_FULL_56_27]
MKYLVQSLLTRLFMIPWVQRRWSRSFIALQPDRRPFVLPAHPLAQTKIALLTTGGVHLAHEPGFDMENPQGDGSFRSFPWETDREALTLTHKYYDSRAAQKDLGVILPIRPLQAALEQGKIGRAGSKVYSFMGHLSGEQLERALKSSVPQVIRELKAEGVEVCFLTPA